MKGRDYSFLNIHKAVRRGLALVALVLAGLMLPAKQLRAQQSNDDYTGYIIQLRFDANPEVVKAIGEKWIKAEQLSRPMKLWRLEFPATTRAEAEARIERIRRIPVVSMVQLDGKLQRRNIRPDDTSFAQQWNMENIGQLHNQWGMDVQATPAWEISTGGVTPAGDTIVVAVIDGGFDTKHPDLDFWKNHREIPGNKIDDDGNGYVDDYRGWNPRFNNDSITPDAHGTHVAGIIGARGNNKIGVTGVNWNVKLMPVVEYDTKESEIIAAYSYIYQMRRLYNRTNGKQGAFVVATNSSFGLDLAWAKDHPVWCAMYDSLGKEGIISAVATANLDVNVDEKGDMPSTCSSPYKIVVTNLRANGTRAGMAATGPRYVDLGAPGTDIYSTVTGGYGYITGTSMATPHVAGAVALMYSRPCTDMVSLYRQYPDSMARLVRRCIMESVKPNHTLDGLSTSGGALNLYNSMVSLDNYFSCTPAPVGIHDGNGSAHTGGQLRIISAAPNPGQTVNLLCQSAPGAPLSLEVYNTLGQSIHSQQLPSSPDGMHSAILSRSTLSPGVYLARLRSGNQLSGAVRIVVSD